MRNILIPFYALCEVAGGYTASHGNACRAAQVLDGAADCGSVSGGSGDRSTLAAAGNLPAQKRPNPADGRRGPGLAGSHLERMDPPEGSIDLPRGLGSDPRGRAGDAAEGSPGERLAPGSVPGSRRARRAAPYRPLARRAAPAGNCHVAIENDEGFLAPSTIPRTGDPLGLNRPSFLTTRVQPLRRPLLRLKKL